MKDLKFPRNEKLKAKKDLDLLFKTGRWLTVGKLRIIVLRNTSDTKIGVSVSKKYFKHAVDRNRIKRLMRESYRLDKGLLHQKFGENFYLMFFWVSTDIPDKLMDVQEFYEKLCKTV